MATLEWQLATVAEKVGETAKAFSIGLKVPQWTSDAKAGQHVDVRLTAEDGYQAQRSYSIASPPGAELVWLTVERLEDGEVSPYLTDELRVGDLLELRGPIGGYFVWEANGEPANAPLVLIAGGSGIVPLMAMIRHRAQVRSRIPTRLLYSARSHEEIIYQTELGALTEANDGFEAIFTLTRSAPAGWTGYARRIDRTMFEEAIYEPERKPDIFICGPTAFVESAAELLQNLGHEAGRIKTERFGPTGGKI